jgi:uncharacterized membrane protein
MNMTMNDGQRTKRYDTNPLDPAVAERAEREMGPVETEAPTLPMPPLSAGYMPPHPSQTPQMFVQPPGPLEARPGAHLGLKPNFAAMLCYVPFLGVIASILLAQSEPKESRFVRFHAKQALMAHIAFWILTIVFSIARAATPSVASLLLAIPQLLFFIASMAGFVLMMVQTYQFKMVRIPVIGDQVE